MNLKERYCRICLKRFKPRRFWQLICGKEDCRKKYLKNKTKYWFYKHKDNRRDYIRSYMRDYRGL